MANAQAEMNRETEMAITTTDTTATTRRVPATDPAFSLARFQEIIREHQLQYGERPAEIALTQTQMRQLALECDMDGLRLPLRPDGTSQYDGVTIHIEPDHEVPEIRFDPLLEPAPEPNTPTPTPPTPEPEPQNPARPDERFSLAWIRENVELESYLIDYNRTTVVRGRLSVPLVNTYRYLTETAAEDPEHRQHINARICDQLYREANNVAGRLTQNSYEIDDELRTFIFWLHSNIKDELRLEADTKFEDLRPRIWPSDEAEITG